MSGRLQEEPDLPPDHSLNPEKGTCSLPRSPKAAYLEAEEQLGQCLDPPDELLRKGEGRSRSAGSPAGRACRPWGDAQARAYLRLQEGGQPGAGLSTWCLRLWKHGITAQRASKGQSNSSGTRVLSLRHPLSMGQAPACSSDVCQPWFLETEGAGWAQGGLREVRGRRAGWARRVGGS